MFASVMGTAGCAVLVFSLFDTMARLQRTDTRQEIADLLADPPLRGSGVTVDQVLDGLRVLGYGAGALAAAGVVLGVFVALRHRGARVGFTVVAALLLLTMPTTGLLPVLPAIAAAMLWRRDARDWFAGRAPVPAARQEPPASPFAPPSTPPPPPPSEPAAAPPHPPHPPHRTPAPSPPYAEPRPPQPAWQQAPQPGQQPHPAWSAPEQLRRPGTVTAAAVLALLGSALGLLVGASVLVVLAVSPATVEDAITAEAELERLDLTLDQVVAVLWGTGALMVLWSLVSAVLAFLVLRRSTVARVLLAVSSGMAALLSLLAILSGVALVTLLLGVVTLALLFTGGANDWFAGRPRGSRAAEVSGSGPPW